MNGRSFENLAKWGKWSRIFTLVSLLVIMLMIVTAIPRHVGTHREGPTVRWCLFADGSVVRLDEFVGIPIAQIQGRFGKAAPIRTEDDDGWWTGEVLVIERKRCQLESVGLLRRELRESVFEAVYKGLLHLGYEQGIVQHARVEPVSGEVYVLDERELGDGH